MSVCKKNFVWTARIKPEISQRKFLQISKYAPQIKSKTVPKKKSRRLETVLCYKKGNLTVIPQPPSIPLCGVWKAPSVFVHVFFVISNHSIVMIWIFSHNTWLMKHQQSHGLLKVWVQHSRDTNPSSRKGSQNSNHRKPRQKRPFWGLDLTKIWHRKTGRHLAKWQKIVEILVPGESPNLKIWGPLKSQLKNPWKIVLRANLFPVGIGKWGNQQFQQNNKKLKEMEP